MNVAVIIPFRGDPSVLAWTLEGFARQQIPPGIHVEIRVHADGVPIPQNLANLLWPPDITFTASSSDHVGSAEAKNLLLRNRPCDIAIMVNADTRPADDFVRNHVQRILSLPPGSMVLGASPYEPSAQETVFDALKQSTPMVFFYGNMRPGELHDFRHAWTLNLSVRYADLQRIHFFNPALRPVFFEDIELAYRLMGKAPAVYFDPACIVTHRHPMTLDQYLNREELLGLMTPVVHDANPDAFETLHATRDLAALAEKFHTWCAMDLPSHKWIYQRTRDWSLLPSAALGVGEERQRLLETIYQMHIPLKRLAFRLGFLRGMKLRPDSHWKQRWPAGLWREPAGLPSEPRP